VRPVDISPCPVVSAIVSQLFPSRDCSSRVRTVAKQAYYLRHVCPSGHPSVRPSVRPSVCISAAPTGRIFIKFGIGDFYEYWSRSKTG
jgi:hypothetical protein